MENSKITKIIIDILTTALNQGNSCLTLKEVLIKTRYQINTNNFETIATAINELVQKGTIVIRQDKIALAKIDQIENSIVLSLKNLINKEKTIQYDETTLDKAISTTEKQLKIKYDETQKSAIKNAISNPISILTDGPGTGKTTIINGILTAIHLVNHP